MNFDVVAVSMEAPTLGRAAYDNTMEALKALEMDGQLDGLKMNGTVMVKPNFTQPPNPSLKYGPRESDLTVHNHVCTDPFSILAACDFISAHGGRPFIAEGTKWPGGARGVFLQMGCESLLEGSGVEVFDTTTRSEDERACIFPSKIWNPDFSTIEVNKIYGEIDLIVNVAKLKSHSNALITGAVKNLYGALEPWQRRAEGHYCADPLWASISRKNMARGYKLLCETFVQVHDAIIRSFGLDEVCIVEGIISGEGDGPLFQPARPRQEYVVLASVNSPATIDAAESYYAGFSPEYLANEALYRLSHLNFTPDEELLESYSTQYFLKLSSEAGMGKIKDFKVYAITSQASEAIPCEALGLLRRGEAFELPTFVRYAANTPLYERIPDGEAEFKVEATV
ncbi:DUF362 domain-containing protein [Methanocella conradii]|uniref:DUF362 domain-containing protein n=1 Tax=Methanocella conradii TaxID=1175444 RepID=UPI00157D9064|nr:DUF362 domain-containing protein [Methanocella conradii]